MKVNEPVEELRAPDWVVASQRGWLKVNRPPITRSWSASMIACASRTWSLSWVETRVRPEDIDHVHVGGHADVRFTALDHRRAPNLRAEVVFVSPDRFQDNQTGAAWFVAQVRVDPASLAEHRQVRVHAGLPAEVYIATRPRSLLDYLIEPINAFKERAMREP
ncbi:MAG TPA: HlyD family secretion protein [Microthrixaceae bacterium]|nr:HlyD family secretion protein [Microthrixaceae bacterium]